MTRKKANIETRPYLTPTEVASLLRVSPVTVRHWALKGWLDAETTAGGHRRFLRREVERFAREREISLEPQDDGTFRVLIVDDDRGFSAYLADALEGEEGNVVTDVAHDGFDAGTKVLSFQPHVVVLDLIMPGLDGFEVCRRLKQDPVTRRIRVVALTGYGGPDQVERILAIGAETCLQKPVDRRELLHAIGVPQTLAARSG
jgi:excisionase family DNA binding protein